MAKKQKQKKVAAAPEPVETAPATGRGRAVVLPDGTLRVDYIRKRYYTDGVERSAIRKELNKIYEDADDKQDIPYQIVFAGTKVSREDYAAQKAKAAESE